MPASHGAFNMGSPDGYGFLNAMRDKSLQKRSSATGDAPFRPGDSYSKCSIGSRRSRNQHRENVIRLIGGSDLPRICLWRSAGGRRLSLQNLPLAWQLQTDKGRCDSELRCQLLPKPMLRTALAAKGGAAFIPPLTTIDGARRCRLDAADRAAGTFAGEY